MKQLFEELAETLKASQKALQEKKDEVEKVEETATAVAADTSEATQEVEVTPVVDKQIQSLMASVDALAKKNEALTEKIDQMENDKRAAGRRVTLASIGLEGKGLQDAFTHSVDFEDFDFRSFCDMVKEIFNQNNLRTQAGEQNESTEEGGTPTEAKAKEEETVGEDNQENVQSTEASEDEDDAVIDMDKLEDEDADLAVESETDPRDLTDEYFDALTSQLAGRNPTWTKIARAKKRQLQEK
jgi:prefoldin subunit 5